MFRVLKREPALLIDLFESAVVLAVALGLLHLSGESQRYLIAAVIALLGVAKGFSTKPFPVTVVPDFARAAFVFFGSVGLTHLTADQLTLIVTFLGTAMTLIQRAQITPVNSPVVDATGAGSGPVRGEAGFMDPWIGLVAAVVGVVLAVSVQNLLVALGILTVVGLCVWRQSAQRRARIQRPAVHTPVARSASLPPLHSGYRPRPVPQADLLHTRVAPTPPTGRGGGSPLRT